jgi:hypothetical protein
MSPAGDDLAGGVARALEGKVSLAALSDVLLTATERHARGEGEVLSQVVCALSKRPRLEPLLHAMMEDPSALAESARLSYQHTNGFSKIVLVAGTAKAFKLRLHLWWPGVETPSEHLHDHRWDFGVVLLAGSYRCQEFVLAAEGDERYFYRYYSPEGTLSFRRQAVGKAKTRCVFDATFGAGTTYVLSHRVIHRVISRRSELAASLFLQGPVVQPCTTVLFDRQLGSEAEEQVAVPGFTPQTLAEELTRFLAHWR